MRTFLGGILVGCASSVGVYLASSHSNSASITQTTDITPPQPPPLTPTPVPTTSTTQAPIVSSASLQPPLTLPLSPSEHPVPIHIPVTPQHLPQPPEEAQLTAQTNKGERATASAAARVEEILSHGWPSGGRVRRQYRNHVLEYDCSRRIPIWVAEHLTQDLLQGQAERSKSQFRSDLDLPWECRAHNSDYRGSGWSRGHMAPAADSKLSQGAMDDTFLLSNILPQDIHNNGGFWNRFEIFCRDLTQRYNDVWVTSGPAFLPSVTPVEEDGDGKKRVTYEVIGESEVAVPTHLYKVIVARTGEQVATGAFIVPNKPLGYEHHLTSFQVPLQHLERKVGLRFYTNLDRAATSDLCLETGCNLLTKVEMDLIIYSSRLKKARDLDKLEKLWREIQAREIPVTPKLQGIYDKKLQDFNAATEAERDQGERREAVRGG